MAKEKFSIRNNTRFVSIEDGRIVFTVLRDGVKDYADYDDTLYKILTLNRLRPYRNNGRLKFNVRAGGVDHQFYLYDLAIACYQGMVNLDSYLEDMQKYYDYKSSSGLSVDHADSNIHNNTRLNISLMEKGLNGGKNATVSRFKPPYYLNSAYCSGEYRVQLEFEVEQPYLQQELIRAGVSLSVKSRGLAVMRFICKDAEGYVSCLKMLTDSTYGWCNPEQTPRQHGNENKDVPYWAGNITNSFRAQKMLATMDRAEFQAFPFDGNADKWGDK